MENALTDKQRKFITLYASGLDKVHAARAAGYQGSGAKKAGSRLLKNAMVRQAIDAIQAEGRTVAVYGLVQAMREAQEVIDFAKTNRNAMAYFKAVQHRAALSGLLVEELHVKVETIDLKGALLEAKRRVLDITPRTRAELGTEADLAGTVGAHWTTNIPGNPLGASVGTETDPGVMVSQTHE